MSFVTKTHNIPTENPLLILDFDGVLCDSFGCALEIFNHLARQYRFNTLDLDKIEYYRTCDTRTLLKQLGLGPLKLRRVIPAARKIMGQKIQNMQPFDGVNEVLCHLQGSGVTIGILSSNSHDNILQFCQYHKMVDFDFMFSGIGLFAKHRKLKKIMRYYNHRPTKSFYMGDETRDIHASHKAGLTSIAVSWGYHHKTLLAQKHPTHLTDRPEELNKILSF